MSDLKEFKDLYDKVKEEKAYVINSWRKPIGLPMG